MKNSTKTAFIWGLAALSGILLLYTSQRVQDVQSRLRGTQAAIERETQTLRVLGVEWAFLSAPARLEAIAQERLDLHGDAPRLVPSVQVIRGAGQEADLTQAALPAADTVSEDAP